MQSIRVLARETGVTSKSIRHWENVGVLPKANRNEHGYRVYPNETADRIRFIQKAKSIGFTLAEIRELTKAAKIKGAPCSDVVKWVDRKIDSIDSQIRFLTELRNRLAAYRSGWKRKRRPPLSDSEVCCLIEALPLNVSKA